MRSVQRTGRVEVVVDADVGDVWRVISDVTRVGEWSHECRSASWLAGASVAVPGARFRGHNRAGRWRWSRTAEIVAVDPPRLLAWRTVPTWLFPDSTDWRLQLSPTERGTLIVQTFRVVRAPWLLDRLYARLIPSHQDRDAQLGADLARIGDAARPGAAA